MSPSHTYDYEPPTSRTFVDRSRPQYHQQQSTRRPQLHHSTSASPPPRTSSDMSMQPDFTTPSSPGSRDQRLIRRSRSSPSPAQDYEDDASRDSHDLSINPRAFERESLVDHLLLSFDRLGDSNFGFDGGNDFFGQGGGGFNFRDIPDDASVASQRTGPYTRGRRSYSSGHHNYHGNNMMGASASSQQLGLGSRGRYGSVDFNDQDATPGFGVTYGRNLNSRRGLSSAGGGQTNAFIEYDDAAPTPTVYSGPRDRSLTVNSQQASLSRKPSKQSMKSTKQRYNNVDSLQPDLPHHQTPASIPPMPAFISSSSSTPSTPANQQQTTPQKASKPGFFRRVFGGGGGGPSTPVSHPSPSGPASGSSATNRAFTGASPSTPNFTNANQSTTTSSNTSSHPSSSQQPHHQNHNASTTSQATPPQAVRNKSSFFRRRKKSVSDAASPPSVPPLPLNKAMEKLQVEHPQDSPVSSLRAVMDPFLKSPGRAPSDAQQHPPLHPHQDPETAYLQKDATIRKVISTEPGSPKARPTFFSESSRRGSDFGKAYPKESRPTTAQEAEDDLGPLEDIPSRIISRPQTSPHAPSGLLPPDSTEPPPIPIRYRRSYDTFKTETPHMLAERTSTWHSGRELRPPSEEVVKPILTAKELEVFQQQEMKRRASENLHSSLDVSAATISKSRDAETSWLATPTPLSAGTNTPTVTLQRDGEIAEPWGESDKESVSDVVVLDEHDDPTEAEEEIAKKIYDGDEMYVLKDRTPFLLTESGPSGVRLRRAYMSLYDWSNINILTALRQMCNRIVLKGETQEVDRIVDAISKRWCECNPNHGFKSADIIHTILYSLLLLNTDLHLAEIPSSQKMTRGQFIKNTMATIKKGLQDSSNEAIGNLAARPAHHSIPVRHGSFPEESPSASSNSVAPSPNAGSSSRLGERASIDYGTSRARNSSKASGIGNLSPRFAPEGWNEKNFIDDGGIALVNKPIGGGIRVWETQVEIILKDFYSSVKEHALPLHGAPIHYPEQSSSNLSVFGSGMLRRSPSTISKCPSEHSVGGRRMDAGRLGSGWAAKNRSRQRVYNGSRAGSSRTSLEERSIWSPGASSTWSKLSLDKTQASTLSVNSLGSAFANDDYKQSIGFANALSHAIIREEASGTGEDHSTIIEDEDLELAGPPWAKEGLVKHKHHLEGVDKKAKNRAWTECFAVIEKGYMRLFQFTPRSKQGIMASNSGVVGGGNWSENAEPIGTFLLRQTLASALPPPGYSKTRPHVWALSLPNGAVHLFQGGTSELVKEWVSTANYWSARLSKEPLVGGVSNMEYGWSDNILDASIPDTASAYGPRISLQESIRSSIDIASGPYVKARLPGDKANISDWQAPAQSMVASPLPESEQLQALQTYVSNIEAELQKHNDLRASMVAAFSPRHSNYQKALANWEKKSSYLLHEIVKFRTYIDALGTASVARERLRVEGEERDEMRRERERSKAAAASTAASGIGAL